MKNFSLRELILATLAAGALIGTAVSSSFHNDNESKLRSALREYEEDSTWVSDGESFTPHEGRVYKCFRVVRDAHAPVMIGSGYAGCILTTPAVYSPGNLTWNAVGTCISTNSNVIIGYGASSINANH